MKKLIPAALFCIIFIDCRKNLIDKQASPEPITTEIVDPPCEEEDVEWGGEFLADARFPGGRCAWLKFIRHNTTYPVEALDAEIVGTVVVQFLVNTNGDVSNVEAVSGPSALRQSAVDVIKKSPKWRPGIANGRQIKCITKQPIFFGIEYE
jgi:protein TonB